MISFKLAIVAPAILAGAAILGSAGGAFADTASDLACKGCVGKRDLGKQAVTARSIRNKTISAGKIRDSAVQARHLADDAKPAGVASALTPGPIELTGSPEIVFSVDLDAPGPGAIVASADFYATTGGGLWSCSLETGDDAGFNAQFGGGFAGYVPANLTRVFPVSSAVPATVNLICTEAAGNVTIQNVNLTALFVPASY